MTRWRRRWPTMPRCGNSASRPAGSTSPVALHRGPTHPATVSIQFSLDGERDREAWSENVLCVRASVSGVRVP
jgi:hypothetical protein